MRRFLSILALWLLSVANLSARSIMWGVEAGWDVRHLSMKSDVFKVDNRAGWFIGPKASLNVPVLPLRIEGAILYSQRGMDFVDSSADDSQQEHLSYLIFPLNARFTISLGKTVGIYALAGPQWSRYINHDSVLDCYDQMKLYVDKSTLSVNVGLGVELLGHVQMGVTYNYAVDNDYLAAGLNTSMIRDFKSSRHTCQIRVSCLF